MFEPIGKRDARFSTGNYRKASANFPGNMLLTSALHVKMPPAVCKERNALLKDTAAGEFGRYFSASVTPDRAETVLIIVGFVCFCLLGVFFLSCICHLQVRREVSFTRRYLHCLSCDTVLRNLHQGAGPLSSW